MTIQDFLAIFSYIIPLLVGILGTFYAIKSIKKQKPVYFKKNSIIFVKTVPHFPELKITYKDVEVETLSSANIIFWNAGNARIEKNDITDKTPLQIIAKEGIKIFSASIIHASTLENEFEIKIDKDGKTIHLNFNYIAKGDNVTIQIIHSGNSANDIDFIGKFKDTGIPADFTYQLLKSWKNYDGFKPLFVMGLSLLILIPIWSYIQSLINIPSNLSLIVILALFLGCFYIIARLFMNIIDVFFNYCIRPFFLFSTLSNYELFEFL